MREVKEQVEKIIFDIKEEGLSEDNIEYLGELVDIHKDLANEEYWKVKEEECMNMRYGNYGRGNRGNYNARRRDSRGRYMDGNYGTNYRGHDLIDEMSDYYGKYRGDMETVRSGNYGAKDGILESLDFMLQAVEDFFMHLKEEAGSEEEMEMIRETARKISQM